MVSNLLCQQEQLIVNNSTECMIINSFPPHQQAVVSQQQQHQLFLTEITNHISNSLSLEIGRIIWDHLKEAYPGNEHRQNFYLTWDIGMNRMNLNIGTRQDYLRSDEIGVWHWEGLS